MIDRILRDTINLLLYGGAFIGLCASCITALSFELTGQVKENLSYIFFIGAATSALYSVHRIVGLQKTSHLLTSERFFVIRKYQFHIRVYAVLWIILAAWLALPMLSRPFLLCLIPGGLIGFAYVIPLLPGGKRLRDLGWGKILMISWSWSWLTAAVPLFFFTNASVQMTVIHGLERFLFIMLIAIPFEIRDLNIDRSLGLMTLPEKLGMGRTRRTGWLIGGFTVLLSLIASFHYFNPAYAMAIGLSCLLLVPLIRFSYKINNDYFFGGVVDGMMILALWIFLGIHSVTSGWI